MRVALIQMLGVFSVIAFLAKNSFICNALNGDGLIVQGSKNETEGASILALSRTRV